MTSKNIKVIFDTNIWISFLIGNRLGNIKRHIVDGKVTIIITEQLLIEIKTVTKREKLKKYFPKDSVKELIDFSKADYLVTGDKDLLEHNPFKTAQILTPNEFEKLRF
jgi:hypothetical protein